MPATPLTFVLNDENKVNCYGFRVPNKTLDLTRFKANPVMLAEHYNGISGVIGKWTNLRVEGSQLLADAEFDEGDKEAKKIKGKVERGYIKGASIGFLTEGFIKAPDGVPDLESGELMEASICAIPGNANAIKLYAANGQLMSAAEITLSLSATPDTTTTQQPSNTDNNSMKHLTLSLIALTALGFNEIPKEGDEGKLSRAIEDLATRLKSAETERDTLKQQYQTLSKSQSKGIIDAAILSGKITEADRADFEELPYELCMKQLSRLPGKTTLGAQVDNPAGAGAGPKTLDEFEKLPLQDQLAFKAANPDAYKKLFA